MRRLFTTNGSARETANSAPAIAGPTSAPTPMRAWVTVAAWPSCAGGTIDFKAARPAGQTNAAANPSTIDTISSWANVRRHTTAARGMVAIVTPRTTPVRMRMRFRSHRSTRAPAGRPMTNWPRPKPALTMPARVAEPVTS
jgi:hypothetical protein